MPDRRLTEWDFPYRRPMRASRHGSGEELGRRGNVENAALRKLRITI